MKKTGFIIAASLLILFFASCEMRQGAVPVHHELTPVSLVAPAEAGSYAFYVWESRTFELPVSGATGWAGINLPLFNAASQSAQIITTLAAGQAFTILQGTEQWWYIDVNNVTGWVMNSLCLINLPDVLPSIIYRNPNNDFSLFRSSGRDIPNVTGLALTQARDFNVRLGREEDIAAALYPMARKIGAAQQAALADGRTLIIYEAFRPHDLQETIYENLRYLYETDAVVRAGISTPPWNIRWFLARSPYNHQRGTAVDASLARIDRYEVRVTGDYAFVHISGFTEYPMQTAMHELSIAAVVFRVPVNARSPISWEGADFVDAATFGTRWLHQYLTAAGLSPLASEWWHFNDLIHTDLATEAGITGDFLTDRTFSRPPRTVR